MGVMYMYSDMHVKRESENLLRFGVNIERRREYLKEHRACQRRGFRGSESFPNG